MKRGLVIGMMLLAMVMPLQGQHNVADGFCKSDDSCRPWVRWWWNGDKVEQTELLRELHLLHDAGIGGVEINPIEFPAKRCDDLGKPSLTWMSDEWLDMLETVLKEAKRLGMGCDLLVGSGWPFGMESLPMEERAQVMLTYVAELDWSDGKPFVITKQEIFDAVDPKVTEANPDRQFELVSLCLAPDTLRSLADVVAIPLPASDTITLPAQFSIVNSQFSTLYALVRCTSFASVINGAPGASGPILDHMNREAVRHYLAYVSRRLEGRLGPMKRWLRAYFVDSMELEGANWTGDFAEEFRRRNGYDLMPWLPFTMFKTGRLGEVTSYEYGAKQSADFKRQVQQVRLDFERTKAELLYERFTTVFADWCRAQGVLSRGQAYGRGFFPLESSTAYDIPEGESWTTNYLRHRVGEEMPDSDYRRGRAYTMINKYVSSAAHQAGRRIVSAEEMTNTYRMFETTLELLKLGSDMSAFSGVTHSVWHGFNYTPPEAGFPGWVQYGSYLNEKNTWWPYFHLLNEYRARVSAILQNAEMQTDIAILLPTDSLWAQYGVQTEPFPVYPKGSPYDIPCLLWEAVHKNGGNCDLITRRQLDTATVRDGKLIVGKKAYKALLLPPATGQFSILNSQFSILSVPDLPNRNYLEWYADVSRQHNLTRHVVIEHPNRFLLQNHYRNDRGDDIFFFVNASLREAVGSNIAFSKGIYQGRAAWVYNPATDEKQLLQLDEGDFWLYLPPTETLFVIFEKSDLAAIAHATEWSPAYNEGQHYFTIPMQWHVTLSHAIEGWTRDTVMQELCDLRETQFKDFSGTIVYTARFHLDSITDDTLQDVTYTPESLEDIDLGQVYDICELTVNGTPCGVRWYGERIYNNLGGLLHAGGNVIEIKVTTTLNNYVHTLTDNGVVQHFVLKRNVPTTPAGLVGPVSFY
ncbi:MAG: glycoside hydrolase family 2 [Bacteroidales bacterium]|nr:glycoside hydrolase family 2 [Bacteroidales bacterium]